MITSASSYMWTGVDVVRKQLMGCQLKHPDPLAYAAGISTEDVLVENCTMETRNGGVKVTWSELEY